MTEYLLSDCSILQTGILLVSAVLIGISKTGIPGLGLLSIALLTMVFPAGTSTGLQLIMLCMGDVFAVAYYRRKADWKIVARLLPGAVAGMALGAFTLFFLSDEKLKVVIGIIILAMVLLGFVKKLLIKKDSVPSGGVFSTVAGVAAGWCTLVGNAAGPVMALYLLSMKLAKTEYMGTCAWFFLTVNCIKLPVFIAEGRITSGSFLASLTMIPLLAAGAWLGIVFIRRVPQKWFENIVLVLVVLAAIKLILSTVM